MGFYRTIFYLLGIEYIGSFEQQQIEEQRQRKYFLLEQIKKTHNIKPIKKILKNKKSKTIKLSDFLKTPIIKN